MIRSIIDFLQACILESVTSFIGCRSHVFGVIGYTNDTILFYDRQEIEIEAILFIKFVKQNL